MRKILFYLGLAFLITVFSSVLDKTYKKAQAAPATHDVTLTTTVLEYITLDITAGSTVAFGNLTPGTPIPAPATGTIATISTNAAKGYTLGVHDSTAAPNSSMLHTDTSTYIPKMTNGTIATPVAWGSNTGVGINLFAADTGYESKWCADTCTTYDDTDNLYAAVPETATTAHTVTAGPVAADTSSWDFKIDVANTQKTGAYSGTVTFTATAVLT